MRAAPVETRLDHILQIDEQWAERYLVLQGKFEGEIARLIAVRDEASEKLGSVQTVEQAAKVKSDADAYSMRVRGDADIVKASADGVAAQAKAALSSAQESDKRALAREDEATRTSAEFRKKSAELDGVHAARMKVVDEKEAAFAARESKIQADSQALAARQTAFEQKLASLRTTTV